MSQGLHKNTDESTSERFFWIWWEKTANTTPQFMTQRTTLTRIVFYPIQDFGEHVGYV